MNYEGGIALGFGLNGRKGRSTWNMEGKANWEGVKLECLNERALVWVGVSRGTSI